MARLDEVIVDLRARLSVFSSGELHGLWERHSRGERVIEKLEEELGAQIIICRDRRGALMDVYRQLVETYRRDR